MRFAITSNILGKSFSSMSKKKSNFDIVVFITTCTLIGKILGILRDSLISYYYGTTAFTDAFFLAMSIPTILLGVFTASTDSAIIPQYKRVMQSASKVQADQLFSMIINTLSAVAVVASFLLFFKPSLFVKLFAVGFSEDNNVLAAKYLRVFSPIGLLHLWYCFFCTYNAAYKKNIVRGILAFSTNLIVVIALIYIRDSGLMYLAIAYLFSNVVCAFLPLVEMYRNNYRHSFLSVDTEGEYKKFWLLFLPIMGGALLNDVQQYVDKNLCSDIVGGISYLNYGIKLVNIFDSILVVGLSVVILPLLSDLEIKQKYEEFSIISSKVTRLMMELLIPFLTILFVLGKDLITVLYGRGKFDNESIHMVSAVLRVYSPLILFTPLITIFSKFFHVKEKNRIPFVINLAGVGINIIFSVILKLFWGTVGVALATTISMAIEIIIYILLIQKDIGWEKGEISIAKVVIMMVPMILAVALNQLWIFGFGRLETIIIKSTIIAMIYLFFYYFFLKEDCIFWAKKCLDKIKK